MSHISSSVLVKMLYLILFFLLSQNVYSDSVDCHDKEDILYKSFKKYRIESKNTLFGLAKYFSPSFKNLYDLDGSGKNKYTSYAYMKALEIGRHINVVYKAEIKCQNNSTAILILYADANHIFNGAIRKKTIHSRRDKVCKY